MSLSRRRAAGRPWLLVWLLLITQQLGVAHLTAHAAERFSGRQDSTLPGEALCERCILYSSVGSPLAGALPEFSPPRLCVPAPLAALPVSIAGDAPAFYRSRAPPLS